MSLPHATNRYLNLLAFFARVAPKEINAGRATLDPDTARRLNAVLDSSPNRRPPRRQPSLLSTSLALLVTGDVLAASGWFFFSHLAGACRADRFPGTAQPRAGRLRRDLRAGLGARGRRCPGRGRQGRMPARRAWQRGSVVYLHYRTQAAMQAVFDKAARGVPTGNCSPGPGRTPTRWRPRPRRPTVSPARTIPASPFSPGPTTTWTSSASPRAQHHALGLYQWWSHNDPGPD
jgi:hypothetical protein